MKTYKYIFVPFILFLFTLSVYAQVDSPPVIDGEKEALWGQANYFIPDNLVKNTPGDDGPSESDFSATFYTLWDASNIYLFVEVRDDKIINTRTDKDHQNDNIEVYFDVNNSKLSAYDGQDDDQLRFIFGWDTVNTKRNVSTTDLSYKHAETANGYVFEIAIPWTALTSETFDASPGDSIGFDLMVTDNDGSDIKDYILAWNSEANDAWQNTSIFGTMKLLANGTTERVIGADEPADHDAYLIDEGNIEITMYVDVEDLAAADTNTGLDPSLPLLTIGKSLELAAEYLGNGKAVKIAIANGIYRESGLTIIRTGNAYQFMNKELVIEGEEKGGVIITGAEQWNEGWTMHAAGVYKHEWPYEMVPKEAWGDRGPTNPIAFRREMVYVNGYWMEQVLSMDALKNNSFYVDETADMMYVQVADTINFEASEKEISLHGDGIDAPWPPARLLSIPEEKDKVVLRNLVFQHANMRINEGAIRLSGWKTRMEDCIIRWNNGIGLNISSETELITIKNCQIDNNGGSGIITWGTKRLTLEGNSTSFNNWRGHQAGYHSHAIGGIKFHHTRDVSVMDHVANNNWSAGLWTDLEIIDAEFINCTVENNYGTGFLIEISKDIYLKKCTVRRNIPGIRCHSSHNVFIDSCYIQGNAVQFTVYKDHRDFASTEWTSQFDGRVWDKTPDNWNITNSTIEGVNDPDWQQYADSKMPDWMKYTNPGYQAFWHFSNPDYMETFFGGATIAYQNNNWIHPATTTPFKDDQGNDLTVEEWEEWISGFASGARAMELINEYAMTNDASPLTIDLLTGAGVQDVMEDNLEEYKIVIEGEDEIPDESALQNVIDVANAFAVIRNFADNNDASELTAKMLLDCGIHFRYDRISLYQDTIAKITSDDLPTLAALQEIINNTITSIEGINSVSFYVYPNPFTSRIYLESEKSIRSVKVLDVSGRTVVELHHVNGKAIDLSGLASGIYLIHASFQDQQEVIHRILKK